MAPLLSRRLTGRPSLTSVPSSLELTYVDALDTVRTTNWESDDSELHDTELDAQTEGMRHLIRSVVNSELPVLSQTQVFDGRAILDAASGGESESFRWMISEGHIGVRLYNVTSLLDAFESALRKEAFLFSAWPELNIRNDGATEVRAEILAALRTGVPVQDGNLQRRIEALRSLNSAIHTAQSLSRTAGVHGQLRLSQVLRAVANVVRHDDAPIGRWLTMLAGSPEAPREARSDMYLALGIDPGPLPALRRRDEQASEFRGASEGELKQLREIVDAAYNLVVACSLGVAKPRLTVTTRPVAEMLMRTQMAIRPLRIAAGELDVKLEPLTWLRMQSFLTTYGDRAPKERRRLAQDQSLLRITSTDGASADVVRLGWGRSIRRAIAAGAVTATTGAVLGGSLDMIVFTGAAATAAAGALGRETAATAMDGAWERLASLIAARRGSPTVTHFGLVGRCRY